MKPPRKPRPAAGSRRPPRSAASRSASGDEARRIADAWGVREEPPARQDRKKKDRPAPKSGEGGETGRTKLSPRQQTRAQDTGTRPEKAKKDRGRPSPSNTRPSAVPGARARPGARPAARADSHTGDRKPAPSRPTSRARGPEEPQRIAKLLARAGVASRREVERMIAEGRIAIDGAPIETPATLLASLKGVTVDGNPVAEAEQTRLFLFHKPAGCLTAERDFSGRKTIYDVLPADLPRLMPVGRLDMNTEGLLLLTNDGELKRKMELPSTGVERTYRARAFGEISQAQLEDLMMGVEVDGVRYGRIDANLERRTGRNQWIEMTLTEGKNREVRRVLEFLGLKVNRLIRTRYGPWNLGESAPGALIEAKQHELELFVREMRRRG